MRFEVRPNSITDSVQDSVQDRMFAAKVSIDVSVRYDDNVERIDKFVIVSALDEDEVRDIIYRKYHRDDGDIRYSIVTCDIEEALTRDS